MVKPIKQTNSHSGELYKFKDAVVSILSAFVYEINVYQIWKNGFSLLDTKYIKSDKLLTIKHDKTIEYNNSFIIEKSITLIGVPKDFIEKYSLELYIPKTKKSKKK